MSVLIPELTEKDFATTISSGTTLVDFWAPWCMPCQMQGVILERLMGQITGEATVAKVNVDAFPELAQRYSIHGIPSLLLFKDGYLLERFAGVQTERALLSAIDSAM